MMRLLALLLALGALPECAFADRLSSLERDPSRGAARQLSRMYGSAKDADARLWLVDVFYARVREHQDPEALEALIQACADPSPDVRRRAVDSLEAFRFLPEGGARGDRLHRIREAARQASRDPVAGVRAAGERMAEWARSREQEHPRAGGFGKAGENSNGRTRTGADGNVPSARNRVGALLSWSGSGRPVLGVLTWVVCFQLLGFAWQRLTWAILRESGEAGRSLAAAWGRCVQRPAWLAVPILSSVGVTVLLGWKSARAILIAAVLPHGGPLLEGWGAAWSWLAVCAACGFIVLLGTSLFAWLAAGRDPMVGVWAAARRLPDLMCLSLFLLFLAWPAGLALRLVRARPAKETWRWAARSSAPWAGALSAALMAQEDLSWRQALRRASRLFPPEDDEERSRFFRRTLSQPQFLFPCLAAPALFAFSLVPSVVGFGFSPTRLFGLWFVSDAAFAVGFGAWSGALLAAAYWSWVTTLGGWQAALLCRRRLHDA